MVSSTSFFLLPTCLSAAALASVASAFQLPSPTYASIGRRSVAMRVSDDNDIDGQQLRAADFSSTNELSTMMSRRSALATTIVSSLVATAAPGVAFADEGETKFVQSYEDFTSTSEGWSYKDVKIGADIGGGDLKNGDRVVFDWSGYTIGYFGRPFEAKGGPQGGAFDKDLSYFRTILGSKTLIPGLECALRSMKPGSIRQVIIPYGPLSYPPEDMDHELVGPKPTTFSGMRALNFVLENPRVDRTLLFNLKLIRVDRSDGKGGFIRG